MRIGLFDSGIGGLTVLKTLLKKYPNNEYIYYGDTLNIPYGDKAKEELLALARENVKFLISKKVDMIIVACGTVSSNCLDVLKKENNIPIISILEPIISYLNNCNYQNVLVMATHATINSHIFKRMVYKNIYELETPKLVPIIESEDYTNLDSVLHTYLDEYNGKIDALVLGCTHYPIIKDKISSFIKSDILDMSEFIEIDNGVLAGLEIYFSKLSNSVISNTKKILNKDDIVIKLKK